MPRISADPYDVVLADDADFVKSVLEPLDALPVNYVAGQPSRWHQYGDDWLAIDQLRRVGGTSPRWEGAIQRSFSNEHPYRSGPTAGTRPLGLPTGEGVAEYVAFLYDESSRLLWLQRQRRVVGKGYFTDYLRALTGVTFSIAHRLRDDSVKRARKLAKIRHYEMSYLTDELKNAKGSLANLIRSWSHYGAYKITVKLTPVRGGTLNANAKRLVDETGSEVEDGDAIAKAVIAGIDENDEDRIIDLIRDKEKFSTMIPVSRSQDPARLVGAVRRIWSENQAKV